MKEILNTMLSALTRGEGVMLCSILKADGSSPRGAGAHMAVFADGTALGTVGGGAVKATMIGTRALKSIEIDPSAVDPDDVEMLQDMIVAAVNEAITQSENATNEAMSKLTPMGFPF